MSVVDDIDALAKEGKFQEAWDKLALIPDDGDAVIAAQHIAKYGGHTYPLVFKHPQFRRVGNFLTNRHKKEGGE